MLLASGINHVQGLLQRIPDAFSKVMFDLQTGTGIACELCQEGNSVAGMCFFLEGFPALRPIFRWGKELGGQP